MKRIASTVIKRSQLRSKRDDLPTRRVEPQNPRLNLASSYRIQARLLVWLILIFCPPFLDLSYIFPIVPNFTNHHIRTIFYFFVCWVSSLVLSYNYFGIFQNLLMMFSLFLQICLEFVVLWNYWIFFLNFPWLFGHRFSISIFTFTFLFFTIVDINLLFPDKCVLIIFLFWDIRMWLEVSSSLRFQTRGCFLFVSLL